MDKHTQPVNPPIDKDEKHKIDRLKFEELENKYIRVLADYQNLLKQTAKEKNEFAQYACTQVVQDILPVYDHLKMAIAHSNAEDHDAWLQGVKYVLKQFKDILNNYGVEEIQTMNEKFDHNVMEAMDEVETGERKLDGTVAKEIKAGYKMNDKLIVPAKVTVYKLKNN